VADRIGIIQGGRLLAEGTLAELRGRAGDAANTSLEDVYLQLVGAAGTQAPAAANA
jgi:ABC-2 type transport system ATP-binding protein